MWRVQERNKKKRIEERERLALRNRVKWENHFELYGGLREDIGMKTYSHGRKDYAKMLKLRFRVRDLDLPERRKIPLVQYTSSREEDVDAHMCPCATTIKSRTHVTGECEIYKEERDVLVEMRKLDECDLDEFGRLESIEKMVAILGDRWCPQTARQEGDRISKQCFHVVYGKA